MTLPNLSAVSALLALCLAPDPDARDRLAKPLPVFVKNTTGVAAIAFSPDGRLLALGGRGEDKTPKPPAELALWDMKARRKVADLTGHTDWIWSLVFSPDGKTLASAGYDKTVRLWDVATGKQLAVMDKSHQIVSLAFSPDGKTLAGSVWPTEGMEEDWAHLPGTVLLWDVSTRKVRAKLEGHASAVAGVTFSPDGAILAAASSRWNKDREWYSTGEIRLWDPATGKLRRTLTGHKGRIDALAFSPNGKTLATGCMLLNEEDRTDVRGEVKTWDVASGKVKATAEVHEGAVAALAFSPDGKVLASGSNLILVKKADERLGNGFGGEVVLLDSGSLKVLARIPGFMGGAYPLAFSPVGRVLAAGDDNEVKMWEVFDPR